MSGQLIFLYPAATRSNRLKLLTSTIRRYSNQGKNIGSGGGIDKERARSTAEEFKRVAEEKGQTAEKEKKARDTAEEATVGTSKPQHMSKKPTNDED
ncbi:hypothetical protein C2S53_000882 [Perilla frutescens var. hirtella]|uniref:Uncharacterized protein n=1 Tax=Perilla frutescens var. hirtella TaxID=608512 RepID=A0AAD4JJ88_PERFH|nr:hypothetical protein C2S53_000882 [Perilla frutescens var. hirtella]